MRLRNTRRKALSSWYPISSAISSIGATVVSSNCFASSALSACTYSIGLKPVAARNLREKVRRDSPLSSCIRATAFGAA